MLSYLCSPPASSPLPGIKLLSKCVSIYLLKFCLGMKRPIYFPGLEAVLLDFPGGLDSKASVYNVGDLGLIPGLGRSLEKEPGRLQPMGSQRVGHD